MKNVLKALTKNLLIPLGLTAAAAATDADAAIHKKMFGSSAAALLTSTEEMIDIIKTFVPFDVVY